MTASCVGPEDRDAAAPRGRVSQLGNNSSSGAYPAFLLTMVTVERVDEAFRAFVGTPDFPCLAGKGAVRQGGCSIGIYGTLGETDRATDTATTLARDLAIFAAQPLPTGPGFVTFAAVFPDLETSSEDEFERRLWAQLELLHNLDDPSAGWDPTVSSDPEDARFSFSFGGRAFFVVGLHPKSSRIARRFQWPTLIFNPQAQFTRLRADGRFGKLRAAIRDREVALQGSLNPNLADFGEMSEARQYSGREAETDWRCPFNHTAP
ncbi:MAG: guanitoxin biosynthesis heme-dependent pre-guanitoxin N-hydroxylase GntA [Gemmatimonadaceae bacterium]